MVVDGRYLFCKPSGSWVLIRPNQILSYEVTPARLFKKGSSALCLKDNRPKGIGERINVSYDIKKDNKLDNAIRKLLSECGIDVVNIGRKKNK